MNEVPRVVLRECADRIEAETIRIRLKVENIDAFISGTDAATALSLGGAGTDRLVRVEVAEHQAEIAHQLLEEDARRVAEAGPWICSKCEEQNEAAFELCWNCSKQRDEGDEQGRIYDSQQDDPASGSLFESLETTEETSDIERHSTNPYQPVLVEGKCPSISDPKLHGVQRPQEATSEQVVGDIRRAILAAFTGIFLLPPILNIYSLFTLWNIGTQPMNDPAQRWKIVTAWTVNLLVLAISVVLWRAGLPVTYFVILGL